MLNKNMDANKQVKKEFKKEAKKLKKVQTEVNKLKQEAAKEPSKTLPAKARQKIKFPNRKALEKRNVMAICEALADPQNNEPLLLAGLDGYVETVGAVPKTVQQVDWIGDETAGYYNTVIIRDSALNNYIYAYDLDNGATATYGAQQVIPTGRNDPCYFSVPLQTTQPTIQPHGQILYPGRLGPGDMRRGYWCDAATGTGFLGTQVSVSAPALQLPTSGYTVGVEILRGKEWQPLYDIGLTPGAPAALFYAPVSTYYSFNFRSINNVPAGVNNISNITISLNLSWSGVTEDATLWGHCTSPNLDSRITTMEKVWLHTTSIQLTNTSNFLNKGGQLAIKQFGPDAYWFNMRSFNSIANAKGATAMKAEEGCYAFLAVNDLTPINEWVVRGKDTGVNNQGNSLVDDAAFDIYAPFLVVTAYVPAVSGTVPAAMYTINTSLEWQTSDQMSNTRKTMYTAEEVHMAHRILSCIPYAYTNDFHISDIWEGIKSVAKDVTEGFIKYGAPVAHTLATVAPILMAL